MQLPRVDLDSVPLSSTLLAQVHSQKNKKNEIRLTQKKEIRDWPAHIFTDLTPYYAFALDEQNVSRAGKTRDSGKRKRGGACVGVNDTWWSNAMSQSESVTLTCRLQGAGIKPLAYCLVDDQSTSWTTADHSLNVMKTVRSFPNQKPWLNGKVGLHQKQKKLFASLSVLLSFLPSIHTRHCNHRHSLVCIQVSNKHIAVDFRSQNTNSSPASQATK